MKIARTIGLTALAALALTALFGTGSALADETTLCKSATTSPYCASENRYPKETLLKGSASDAKIESNLANLNCSASSIETKTQAVSGEPLGVDAPSLSFSGCKESAFGSKCTVTGYKSPSSASLSWTDHGNGLLGGTGEEIEVKCSTLGWECNYELGSSFTLNGSSAQLSAAAIPLKIKKGFFCPTTSQFSATYSLSSPGAVSVARAQTTPVTGLCKGLEICKPDNLYAKGTKFTGTSSAIGVETKTVYGVLTCSGESSLGIETGAESGEPLPLSSSLALVNCKFPTGDKCTFYTSGFKGGLTHIEATTSGKWSGAMTLEMNCSTLGASCVYATDKNAYMTFYGGHPEGYAPKVVAYNNMTLTATSAKGGCAFFPTLAIYGTFTIPIKDNPVWVTSVTY